MSAASAVTHSGARPDMFGFVTASLNRLSEENKARYKACYCGLCRSLSERHGSISRMTLTYDMTFLVLVLCSLYEPTEIHGEEPCPAHPLKKRAFWQTEISDYAADMNLALAYLNCLDDWEDEINLAALAEAKLMKSSYESIFKAYPRQCGAIQKAMSELKDIEQRREENPDAAAAAFGRLMAELFVIKEDRWSDTLRSFGMALGEFIYVMDACIDLRNDKRYYKYNPFVHLYGRLDEQQRFKDILEMLLADCVRSFDDLPLVQDTELIKNILCSGVWIQFNRHYGITS